MPDHIRRPPYAASGQVRRVPEPAVKSPDVIARMRRAGALAAEVLRLAGERVRPGVATDELDVFVHDLIVSRGAYPSPLNYQGYPKSLCTSVNEVICHGIPDSRKLADGDIVNVDVTAFIEGVHGDTSCTFLVGDVDERSAHLVEDTRQAMHAGISVVCPGARVYEIGRAIESVAVPRGHSVVREFIGHGIGDEFHTSLQIPHYYDPRNDTVLLPGMTFTVEPMVNLGSHKLEMWEDNWTVVTRDLQRSAQFEHTVLVTEDGHELLTVPADGVPAEVRFAGERMGLTPAD